jgi:hypothetical protein
MRLGGGRDHHGVAGGQQVGPAHRRRTAFAGHRSGTGGIAVVHPRQHGPARGRHLQGMEAPEMSGAGNSDPQA